MKTICCLARSISEEQPKDFNICKSDMIFSLIGYIRLDGKFLQTFVHLLSSTDKVGLLIFVGEYIHPFSLTNETLFAPPCSGSLDNGYLQFWSTFPTLTLVWLLKSGWKTTSSWNPWSIADNEQQVKLSAYHELEISTAKLYWRERMEQTLS